MNKKNTNTNANANTAAFFFAAVHWFYFNALIAFGPDAQTE